MSASLRLEFVGNKEKGRTSRRVLQEKGPNFPKNEHFKPTDTLTCVYQGVRNVCFSEN